MIRKKRIPKLLCMSKHALQASPGPVIVRSPSGDTDILVILLSLFTANEQNIYLDNGHGNSRKTLQINTCKLPVDIQKALIGLHAFTGNDYISSFFRKGKAICYSLLTKDPQLSEAFVSLGDDWSVSDHIISCLEKYVCSLYGKGKCSNVNEARQQIFWEKYNKNKQIVDLSILPPCRESLGLHIRRANYVSCLWKRSLCAVVNPPNPSHHGWNSDLTILWTTVPFPDDILPLLIDSETGEDVCDGSADELSDDDEMCD